MEKRKYQWPSGRDHVLTIWRGHRHYGLGYYKDCNSCTGWQSLLWQHSQILMAPSQLPCTNIFFSTEVSWTYDRPNCAQEPTRNITAYGIYPTPNVRNSVSSCVVTAHKQDKNGLQRSWANRCPQSSSLSFNILWYFSSWMAVKRCILTCFQDNWFLHCIHCMNKKLDVKYLRSRSFRTIRNWI